ncbi:MAG: response regulator [Nitrosomonas sp.]|uniref:response regulator n=1 Tax=Nitrosomonas sp. TaxID=42353 RepID=UPI0025CEB168|nr:response regulator [Nitrosomonas sp.]MBY0475282.1 response regulator [Nitrosomonas sp.]
MDNTGVLKGIKVMIIDDSSTIRRSAEIFLKPFGCEVVLAENGFEAMSKVVDNHPDIIFVDITMPRLDGYQACMLIKKNPIYQSIPVIMLSSKDGLFDKARGRIAGSNSYLTKPFTADGLFSIIRNYIE